MVQKVGRPRSENPKNKQLKVKMTKEEFLQLEKLAKQKNMTKSEIVMKGIELVKSEQ